MIFFNAVYNKSVVYYMKKNINYAYNIPVRADIIEFGNYPWHMHTKDIQICYVLSGEARMKFTYGYYHLKENHIHFIHSYDIHGFQSLNGQCKMLVLSFDLDHFSKKFPNLGAQIFSVRSISADTFYTHQATLRKQIFSLAIKLMRDEKKQNHYKNINDCATEIFKTLYKDFRNFRIGEDKLSEYRISHDSFQIDRISRIICYIYENYNSKISLAAIAADENINAYYLSHLFQRFVGKSFRDFINMTRVEMSEYEILATDKAISKIALDAGFSNYNYYIDAFIKWFGMHPKKYRNEFRAETILEKDPDCTHISLYDAMPLIEKELSKIEISDIPDTKKTHISLNLSLKLSDKKSSTFIHSGSFINEISERLFTHIPEIRGTVNKNIIPANFYSRHMPHEYCISLLDAAVRKKDLSLENFQVIDTEENKNGLFAINGMKKPLYYLHMFWFELFEDLTDCGPGYIVTRSSEDYSIIVFNDSSMLQSEMIFDFNNVSRKHKLTQKIISASHSCISYWQQLDFTPDIDQEDYRCIENMTIPETSFRIVPGMKNYQHTTRLEPMDIAHIKFFRE